ncbi:hypothetical protein LTR09_010209 [Extremus antarcticus]|uniref:Uncharacterized protein n=1 Tax=Extremus antarcticus TaxID=702011 RepID=A0AAJ0D7P5_9PEZI|nr:hypothetical protein LTR09_010209 [Extremus antarcticus]
MAPPSTVDRENIGKRRRVRKPSQRRAIPAIEYQTFPRPQQYVPQDYMMSGALPVEDIEVKIGTDAFASHTQQSRRSRTPGQTSMRHPSTDVALLSEESMLLGEDDDVFEPMTIHTRPDHDVEGATAFSMVAETPPMGEMLEYVQHVPDDARMECAADRRAPNDDTYHENVQFPPTYADAGVPSSALSGHHPERMRDRYQDGLQQSQTAPRDCRVPDLTSQTEGVQDIHTDPQSSEDEARWRRLAGIGPHASSHASMAAVKSSSLHLTHSESSLHRAVMIERARDDTLQQPWSTPKGAGTQASILNQSQETVEECGQSQSQATAQSPSASLQLITRLAEQPTVPDLKQIDVQDDDELWKSFIIGSQSSSLAQSPTSGPATAALINTEEMELLSRPSPTAAISGLGTSNRSTDGGMNGSHGTAAITPSTGAQLYAHQEPQQAAYALGPPELYDEG